MRAGLDKHIGNLRDVMIISAVNNGIAVAIIGGKGFVPVFLEAFACGFAHAFVMLLALGVLSKMFFVLALGDGSLLSIPVGVVDVVAAIAVGALHQHYPGPHARTLGAGADIVDSDVFENSRHGYATSFVSPSRCATSRPIDPAICDQNCRKERRSRGARKLTPP